MDPSKLSQAARQKYDQLMGSITELVDQDRRREPKLTEAERTEVTKLEARIEFLAPRVADLQAQLDAAIARQVAVDRGRVTWLIEGEANPGELATEILTLGELVRMLQDALRAAMLEAELGRQRIRRIKDDARDREVRHG